MYSRCRLLLCSRLSLSRLASALANDTSQSHSSSLIGSRPARLYRSSSNCSLSVIFPLPLPAAIRAARVVIFVVVQGRITVCDDDASLMTCNMGAIVWRFIEVRIVHVAITYLSANLAFVSHLRLLFFRFPLSLFEFFRTVPAQFRVLVEKPVVQVRHVTIPQECVSMRQDG